MGTCRYVNGKPYYMAWRNDVLLKRRNDSHLTKTLTPSTTSSRLAQKRQGTLESSHHFGHCRLSTQIHQIQTR